MSRRKRVLFFILFLFLSFLSNGVKGRVPTFPRRIDRYLHNSGALAAHRAQERHRTYAASPFRAVKKKQKKQLSAINKVPLSANNHEFPNVWNRASRSSPPVRIRAIYCIWLEYIREWTQKFRSRSCRLPLNSFDYLYYYVSYHVSPRCRAVSRKICLHKDASLPSFIEHLPELIAHLSSLSRRAEARNLPNRVLATRSKRRKQKPSYVTDTSGSRGVD